MTPSRIKVPRIPGRRIFCAPACREGFRSDRAHGAIYPAIPAMGNHVTWYDWCRLVGACPYCQSTTAPARVSSLVQWRHA